LIVVARPLSTGEKTRQSHKKAINCQMLIILAPSRLIYSPPSSNSMLSIFTTFAALHDNPNLQSYLLTDSILQTRHGQLLTVSMFIPLGIEKGKFFFFFSFFF
jgi:hypothetical protein